MSAPVLPAVTSGANNRESPVSIERTAAVSHAPAVEAARDGVGERIRQGRRPKRTERRQRGVRLVTTNPYGWTPGQQERAAAGWKSAQRQADAGQQLEPQQARQATVPAVDIIENEDHLWVFIDLPGFTEDEIDVRADENAVVLRADRTGELEEGRQALLNERATHVERDIALPVPVQTNGSRAVFENGVCKIVLPKAATDRYTKIEFSD